MVKTKIVKDTSGTFDLCETYSTQNLCLMQTETGIVYGSSVIDPVSGYDGDGNPFGKFTYAETGEIDETRQDEATEPDYLAALAEMGVDVNEESET